MVRGVGAPCNHTLPTRNNRNPGVYQIRLRFTPKRGSPLCCCPCIIERSKGRFGRNCTVPESKRHKLETPQLMYRPLTIKGGGGSSPIPPQELLPDLELPARLIL